MTDYKTPVNEFLANAGINMTVKLIGNDCPTFCKDAGKFPEEIGKFPRKHHIHGQHWIVRFVRGEHTVKSPGKEYSVDFWDSYNDAEYRFVTTVGNLGSAVPDSVIRKHGGNVNSFVKFPKRDKREPTAYDVLSAITQHEPGTFEDWCGDFGYETDSRKAHKTWESCWEDWRKVSRFFSAEELKTLREIAV